MHVWEITGRSSQTRVTRTACIDNKGHNSHDTAPRRIMEECSVYGMTTGSISHSAAAQKTWQWKIPHTHQEVCSYCVCLPFFPLPHQEKRFILLAMTNKLLEHERFFYEEAEGSNFHAYFSMSPTHGLNSFSLGTAQTQVNI